MGGVGAYKVLGLASSKTRLVGVLMGVNGGCREPTKCWDWQAVKQG